MKTYLFFIVSLLLTNPSSYAGNLPGYTTLFTLERTTNTNQVVYEANLADANYPIHPYWVMKAQDGHTEELTNLERKKAFGVVILSQTPTQLQFAIVSFLSHPITVQLNPENQPYATMSLSPDSTPDSTPPEKILVDFYLSVSGLIPKVSNVDVSYRDIFDGPILKESFDPN